MPDWLAYPRNISQTNSMAGRVSVKLLLTNHRTSLPTITFPPKKKWLNPPHSSCLDSNASEPERKQCTRRELKRGQRDRQGVRVRSS